MKTRNKTTDIQRKDDRHIILFTSAHNPQRVMNVKRKHNGGSRIEVTCPIAIYGYTCYKRGVDRFDQIGEFYSANRIKK